ncbi:MAG: glycosyltransferase, partial [Muribaculaceae bacterium]|nr:glycosyltransferase [Muribaculaceae bacterium]
MKKISILMPAYNESGNLKAMVGELDSLTNSGLFVIENIEQTVNLNDYEWEYVFVNDGSKDNTL